MKRNKRKYAILALAAVILAGAVLLSGVMQAEALEATLSGTEISGTPGDINGDGKVDAKDLALLLSDFGKSGAGIVNQYADINGDNRVDSTDLSLLLAGYGKAEPDPVLPTQISINAIAGKEYDITLNGSGITSFSGKEIKVTYDAAVFEIVDLSAFTKNKETVTGPIAAVGINITRVSPGEIRFLVDKTIPAGKQWSGVVNVLRLRAKATAQSVISVE